MTCHGIWMIDMHVKHIPESWQNALFRILDGPSKVSHECSFLHPAHLIVIVHAANHSCAHRRNPKSPRSSGDGVVEAEVSWDWGARWARTHVSTYLGGVGVVWSVLKLLCLPNSRWNRVLVTDSKISAKHVNTNFEVKQVDPISVVVVLYTVLICVRIFLHAALVFCLAGVRNLIGLGRVFCRWRNCWRYDLTPNSNVFAVDVWFIGCAISQCSVAKNKGLLVFGGCALSNEIAEKFNLP